MNEIKFRAWDSNQKQLWFPETIGRGYFTENLMQFTGLKDKNGKDIYEGDIVKYVSTEWLYVSCICDNEECHNEKIGAVSWVEGRACYWVMNRNKFGCFSQIVDMAVHQKSEIGADELVVIGNIYENPELLK